MAQMAQPSTGFKALLGNPVFLASAAGAVVLAVIASRQGGGGGGGTVDNSAALASQLSQDKADTTAAIQAQGQSFSDALAAEEAARQAGINDALTQFNAAYNLNQGQAASKISGLQSSLDALKKQVADLAAKAKAAGSGEAASGAMGQTQVYDVSPGSSLAMQALAWSQKIGVPFAEGLTYVQHEGRLPKDLNELALWRQKYGTIDTSGHWHVGIG